MRTDREAPTDRTWQGTPVPDGYADSTLVEALRRELSSRGAFVPPIAVERVAAIDRGPGGKAPLIRSTIRRS